MKKATSLLDGSKAPDGHLSVVVIQDECSETTTLPHQLLRWNYYTTCEQRTLEMKERNWQRQLAKNGDERRQAMAYLKYTTKTKGNIRRERPEVTAVFVVSILRGVNERRRRR